MPSTWSSKDERMYEHVKDSEKERGRSTGRAKEIAARTVNKHRSEEGRTKEQMESRGSGSSTRKSGGSSSAKSTSSSRKAAPSKSSGSKSGGSKSSTKPSSMKRGTKKSSKKSS